MNVGDLYRFNKLFPFTVHSTVPELAHNVFNFVHRVLLSLSAFFAALSVRYLRSCLSALVEGTFQVLGLFKPADD